MSSKKQVARAIIIRDGLVLLLVRADHDKDRPGDWDLPGGGIEPTDESVEHGMVREIAEETGLTVSIEDLHEIMVPEFNQEDTPFERHVFWCIAPNGNIQLEQQEHSDYRWVRADEALRLFRHPFYGKALEHLFENKNSEPVLFR